MTDVPSSPDTETAIVVFGLDDAGRAHASRFSAGDAELAEKAAGLMGFRVLRVVSDHERSAAQGLPAGRIFASGKGFVPFVKRAAYDRLYAIAGPAPAAAEGAASILEREKPVGDRGSAAKAEPDAEVAPAIEGGTEHPQEADNPTWAKTFEAIAPGCLVLAPETDRLSWWVSIVLRPRGDGRWVLRWRDAPELPEFVRAEANLALLNPASNWG